MDSLLNQEFETMAQARDKIKETIITAGLSYKKHKSNQLQYVLICKESNCLFRLRASYLKRIGIIRITLYTPHTCSFTTHSKFRPSNAVSYTLPHHIDTISSDRTIKPKQIANQERLQHSNQLSYQQAWRTKEKAIKQIEGDQSEQFALLPLLCHYIQETHDEYSKTHFELYPDQSFHRLFIAPGALRQSFGMNIRHLIALDATHTTSRMYSI